MKRRLDFLENQRFYSKCKKLNSFQTQFVTLNFIISIQKFFIRGSIVAVALHSIFTTTNSTLNKFIGPSAERKQEITS